MSRFPATREFINETFTHAFGSLDSSDYESTESESDFEDVDCDGATESSSRTDGLNSEDDFDETSATVLCSLCAIHKPLASFKLQSRYIHSRRRGTSSTRCDECRDSDLISRKHKRHRKRVRRGDGKLIQNVTWPEMMAYFERDVRHDVE